MIINLIDMVHSTIKNKENDNHLVSKEKKVNVVNTGRTRDKSPNNR